VKIEEIETFICADWLFVRVHTDTGLSGVGESTYFMSPEACADIVRSFADALRGCDPMPVEHHWMNLYRSRSMRGMAIVGALSAIDQALWDIRGKHFEVPVWQLLGGKVRERVRAMLVLTYGTLEEVCAAAAEGVAQGYTALKVLLFQSEHHAMTHAARLADLMARAQALRETVGWEVDLGIELHRNMAPGEAIALIRELEPIRPFFVEDPIPPDSVLSFGEVAAKSRVPMAAGERNTTIWEFREYVEQAGVHHIRPDIGVAGGFTHMRKICALAEAHHQGIIPHAVPSGPVATAAHVQLGAATLNWEAQEHRPQEQPPWTDVVNQVPRLVDGFFAIPETPGLGIELDEAGVLRTPARQRGHGTPRRIDGAIGFR
jgi:galactonate dehydratase